jgi:hypothetical protein
MPDNKMPLKWYYRRAGTQSVEGPFDLLEMAGMLAAGDITPETPTRDGAAGAWRAFREHRDFGIAKEMPPGIIVRHLDERASEKKPFNLFRWGYQFLWLTGGVALYTVGCWFWSHFPYAHPRHDSNDWLMLLFRWLLGHNNSPH